MTLDEIKKKYESVSLSYGGCRKDVIELIQMVEEAVPFAEFTSRHSPFKKEREFANTWLDSVRGDD